MAHQCKQRRTPAKRTILAATAAWVRWCDGACWMMVGRGTGAHECDSSFLKQLACQALSRQLGDRKVDIWRFNLNQPQEWESFVLQTGDAVIVQWDVADAEPGAATDGGGMQAFPGM